jgi:glutathione S-transferase
MQLTNLPVSPFAARVRIAIYAKKLDVTFVPPPAGWPSVWDQRLGVIGRVPVLISDNGVIPESQVILEYLEERFPGTRSLLPRDAEGRARVRLLSRLVDLYLMPPVVSMANGEHERLNDVLEALQILDDLVDTPYAAGSDLSLADCAVAPALFATRVTSERHCIDVFAKYKTLGRYGAAVEQDKDVGRVLLEMQEGLDRLEAAIRPDFK